METFKYICKKCNFCSNRRSHFEKHLLTKKHMHKKKHDYVCICGKNYKHRSSLNIHRQKCEQSTQVILTQINNKLTNLQQPYTTITNNNNGTINNFNLNFYLNETCKDAINISDFVNSINLSLEDLEHTGRKGYVEGITNIFKKNLNNIEKHLRPVHCSDLKREIMYIKSNNKWLRESDKKPVLTNAIKSVANENIRKISDWRKENPDCGKADSRKNNLYLKIIGNAMCGSTDEEIEMNYARIIKNIAKQTTIDKNKD
jgi:hypothetical protein